MNRRGFFATAMACLLTKKMPVPRPMLVGCVRAPYKVPYRTPMIRLSDIKSRRFNLMTPYGEVAVDPKLCQDYKLI